MSMSIVITRPARLVRWMSVQRRTTATRIGPLTIWWGIPF